MGNPQQRSLPNVHNKDDKFAFIYHLSKDTPLRRTDTVLSGLGTASSSISNEQAKGPSAPAMDEPDLTRQASDLKIKPTKK